MNQLVKKISSEIIELGPISFARFMELALYDSEYGYYMTHGKTPTENPRGNGDSQIGWQGDFYTTPCLSPLLAKALVRQAQEIDEDLGHPDPFIVLEMGAGEGLLARDFLSHCEFFSPQFFQRVKYILIDRSPSMKVRHEQSVASFIQRGAQVSWASSLEECDTQLVTGMLFSNELVDAFPVHRIKVENGNLKELYVDFEEGQFVERVKDPSSTELEKVLGDYEENLPDGFTTEVNLRALSWMKDVARVMKRGVVLTIDYGHVAQDFYSPSRKTGTLLCYTLHRVHVDPYQQIGLQDITAHVNFSSLAIAGKREGLEITGFTDLMHFLMGLGIEEMIQEIGPDSEQGRAAAQLLHPAGMGRTFKILIQHKATDEPKLSGLRYRPFFHGVLTGDQTVGKV